MADDGTTRETRRAVAIVRLEERQGSIRERLALVEARVAELDAELETSRVDRAKRAGMLAGLGAASAAGVTGVLELVRLVL